MSTISPQVPPSQDISNSSINYKPYDVYLGRGNDLAERLGNRIYHRMINEYRYMYQESTCHQVKTQVAMQIIQGFHTLKGTFYYRKNDVWEEAPYEKVLKRVKQALQGKVRFQFRSQHTYCDQLKKKEGSSGT